MAAVLHSIAVAIISKLAEQLKEEWRLQGTLKKDVESLEKELRSMHAALRKIDEVPPEQQIDEHLKIWAEETRELSSAIESAVKTHREVEGANQPSASTDGLRLLMKKLPELFTKGNARHKIAEEIDDIKSELRESVARRDRYMDVVVNSTPATAAAATSSSAIDPPRPQQESDGSDDDNNVVSLATGALDMLISNLAELVSEKDQLYMDVRSGVGSLAMELTFFHDFFRELAQVPHYQLDEQVKLLAKEVRELCCCFQDKLSSFLQHVVAAEGPAELIASSGTNDGFKFKGLAKWVRRIRTSNQISAAIQDSKYQLRDVHARHRRYMVDAGVAHIAAAAAAHTGVTRTTIVEPRLYIDHATGAMGTIVPKLGQLLKEEYKLPEVVKKEVKSVSKELRGMHAAVRKILMARHRLHQQSQQARANAVRDLSYRIDDLMARHRLHQQSQQAWANAVRDLSYRIDDLMARHRLHQQSQQAWANTVRDLSYRIDDIVDTLLDGLRTTANPGGFKGFLRVHNKIIKRYHQVEMVNGITAQVHDLAARHDTFRFDRGYENLAATATTALFHDQNKHVEDYTELIGMDEAKNELLNMLTGGAEVSKQETRTVSIVGLGGLGKTTLACLVSRELKSQFKCVAFVSVSHMPDIEDIFKEMLLQLGVKSYNNILQELAKDEIRNFLQVRRYLVIIDDLWNIEDWSNISCCLPTNDHGSRVIITTRCNDIAKRCYLGHRNLMYEINPLGYENSKRLFLKQFLESGVSSNCPEDVPPKLLAEILKKCSGMPSAIISIASLLASKVTTKDQPWQGVMNSLYSYWKKMMDSLHSASGDAIPGLEYLRENLSLSYIRLPSHLKTCLLYLVTTISSKKQRIERDKLVRKWIAEGFISKDESRSPEEVANVYFDELISWNVIQHAEHGNYCIGEEEPYEVNYMMLYALRLISHEDNFTTLLPDSYLDNSQKHKFPFRLIIQCSDAETSILTEMMDLSNVRSITVHGIAKSVWFKHLKYVRVLDLDGCECLDNSDVNEICQMFLLKYLSLKETQVTVIPPQIESLRYLESLDVRQTRVEELPKELVQLQRLAHLLFGQTCPLAGVKLPAGSNEFKSVKVLGIVDTRECSASVIQEITELTEITELALVLYDDRREWTDNLLSSIGGKFGKLQSLLLCGDSDPSDELLLPASPNQDFFPLLEKLKVAGRFVKVPRWIAQLSKLKKLVIRVCKLEQDHLEILGGLQGLTTLALALICIPRKKHVAIIATTPAGFTSLKTFTFDCRVPWITFGPRAMPRLKHLHMKLYACTSASKIPSGIIYLDSLEKIILGYSSEYKNNSGVIKTIEVVKDQAASHTNRILLSINGAHDTFPSKASVETRITETEIEEEC